MDGTAPALSRSELLLQVVGSSVLGTLAVLASEKGEKHGVKAPIPPTQPGIQV